MSVPCVKCGKPLTAAQLAPGLEGVQCAHCGATVPVFDQNTLVTTGQPVPVAPVVFAELQVAGYEILNRLGEGGMGIVYLGRQMSLDRKVAIKVLSPMLLQDPNFQARFDREIVALVRLSHPHIVTIFDRGRSAAGQLYYVMEYVEGESGAAPLDLDRLITAGRLDSQRTRELMLQIVQALGFAHREGIIHRDVKPSNILIDRHGFAKVADFGIACMRGDFQARHVTVANASVGTGIYMSPEQHRDAASVDQRSDIYGAGIMLYQMLTGQLPLAGYAPPSITVPGLSRQWDAIVAKAIQPRPADRFADMAQFEAALNSVGPTVVAQPRPAPATGAATPPPSAGGTAVPACPQCGGTASEADLFCVTCGVAFWCGCRRCGQKVFVSARFCPGCRADLQQQRVFEDYVQRGQDHIETAKLGQPCIDGVRHLEQARLALAKSLNLLDDANARSLMDEVHRLTCSVAWQAGEVAAQAKRLTEANYCYEQITTVLPGHPTATACLDKIRGYRVDLIKKAERLFSTGQRNKAITLLRTGVEQFADDFELERLLGQYHENNAQLQELRDRLPPLVEQNRWCEVTQILAQLRQSGIPMKGLDEDTARAQQRLASVAPLLAAAASALEHGDPAQALALAKQVLEQVTDHAKAKEVAKVAKSRAATNRRRRRALATVLGLVFLAIGGGAGYLFVTEAITVDEAQQQIKNGQYDAGTRTLNALSHRYFHKQPITYLQAVAKLKGYAASKEIPKEAQLEASKKLLLEVFDAEEGRRMQAKLDLANTLEGVPADATDHVARSLAVAQAMRDLLVAEPEPLAAALVAAVQKHSQSGRPVLEVTDASYVLQILEWDPGAAGKIVELALPDKRPLKSGMQAIVAWAAKDLSAAPPLSRAVIWVADWHVERNQYPEARDLVETARQADAKCDTWSFWLKHLQKKVERKDAEGASKVLALLVEQNSGKLPELAILYTEVASKFPGLLSPPPQLEPHLKGFWFEEQVTRAEQAVKAEQYPQALTLLEQLRERSATLFQGSEKAQSLYIEASVQVALGNAKQMLDASDFEAAAIAANAALTFRPEDAGAKALRTEILQRQAVELATEGERLLREQAWDEAYEFLKQALQRSRNDAKLSALFDQANVQRLRSAAKLVKDNGDFGQAVDQILEARAILDRRPAEAWSVPLRQSVDALAETLTDTLASQAEKLSGQRQYEEAEGHLEQALRLSPTAPTLLKLQEQIDKLGGAAGTANLTGKWQAPSGLLVSGYGPLAPDPIELQLTEQGKKITLTMKNLPNDIVSFQGHWQRKNSGARLFGTFDFVLKNQKRLTATVEANVKKDAKTIAVKWKQFKVTDLRKQQFELDGFADWMKVE